MRKEIESKYGASFLQFDSSTVVNKCHVGLSVLSDDDGHYRKLLAEFMSLTVSPEKLFVELKKWQPRLLWGQLRQAYPTLSVVLDDMYRCAASTAGIERHHKVGKRVLNSGRERMGAGKVEKQVAISHNDMKLDQDVSTKWHELEKTIADVARIERADDIVYYTVRCRECVICKEK